MSKPNGTYILRSDVEPKTIRVLSIDAWGGTEPHSWEWNNWHCVGNAPLEVCDMKPRALLRWMREAGFLSDHSKGRCAIENDQYNIVIVDRHTCEPLFALEYGAVEP
jgi:hypothetical protein